MLLFYLFGSSIRLELICLTFVPIFLDIVHNVLCQSEKNNQSHHHEHASEKSRSVMPQNFSAPTEGSPPRENKTTRVETPPNQSIPKNAIKLELTGYSMITSRVLQLTFTRSDKLPLPFVPGQFVTFLLPHNGKLIRRSYSLANIPDQFHNIEVAIAPVEGGFATKILFSLKVGDELYCVGPAGKLILPETETPSHYVLVATGTGVAPYRTMLPIIAKKLEKNDNLNVTLLLGVRYASDLLYAEDFIALSKKYERFHFRGYLSKEKELTTYQYSGYVQSAFEELHLDPTTALVYLCGNPNMIDDSVDKLKSMGFQLDRIRREKYVSRRVK